MFVVLYVVLLVVWSDRVVAVHSTLNTWFCYNSISFLHIAHVNETYQQREEFRSWINAPIVTPRLGLETTFA